MPTETIPLWALPEGPDLPMAVTPDQIRYYRQPRREPYDRRNAARQGGRWLAVAVLAGLVLGLALPVLIAGPAATRSTVGGISGDTTVWIAENVPLWGIVAGAVVVLVGLISLVIMLADDRR